MAILARMEPLHEWAQQWGLTYYQARKRAERGTLRYPFGHPRQDHPVAVWRDPASGRRYVVEPDDRGYSRALSTDQLRELYTLVTSELHRRGLSHAA